LLLAKFLAGNSSAFLHPLFHFSTIPLFHLIYL
jgi:hypothetical protein